MNRTLMSPHYDNFEENIPFTSAIGCAFCFMHTNKNSQWNARIAKHWMPIHASHIAQLYSVSTSIKYVIHFFRFSFLWEWLSFGSFICASCYIQIRICMFGGDATKYYATKMESHNMFECWLMQKQQQPKLHKRLGSSYGAVFHRIFSVRVTMICTWNGICIHRSWYGWK